MLACRVTPTPAPHQKNNAVHADALPPSGVRPRTASEVRLGLVTMRPELFARALRMTRSATLAEDVVQDAVERAIRFESSYETGTNLRAWLNQILFSVFISRCRRSRRERNALDALTADPCAWINPEYETPTMKSLSCGLRRALDRLPAAYRSAVVLVDVEEVTYKDAALRLGVPPGTVMSRLHRGRRMLAEMLGGTSDLNLAAA
ncbi:RNA polymerase sigma factor [Chondromyces crocatus]|uniref:RNA polymerase sigma factor n=1 Tax=Chondromyces crocatus TaxID=52 RepID=A0A0K1EU79_CHOCO|nr:RNA polymerase sigma factor [Chondromyces crocatus]AKT44207.1 uncharacterized protein CMC5_084470 [Chondromyces crocatus]